MAINLIQGKQIATASWAENSISSSFAITSSYALTASFAQNELVTPILVDSYIGTRLQPTNTTYNGFIINRSVNGATGFISKNPDNTGNGAISGFSALGSGSTYYDGGISMNYVNNGYYITYLRNSGFIYSSVTARLIADTLDFRTGPLASATSKLTISNSGNVDIPVGSLTVNNGITGSLFGTSSFAISSSQAQNAQTSSYLNTLNQNLTFNGNLVLNGTASISTLVVNQTQYSSGSNQLGDGIEDTQTLFGTVTVPTGSLTVTGSITATQGFTGSLLGNASTVSSIASNIENNTDNHILTATGGSTINGESNLTFDGTLLSLGQVEAGRFQQGGTTSAVGTGSHAEGQSTGANGEFSHAEGRRTTANGNYSHTEGYETISSGSYQHVQGQFNIPLPDESAFIIGNGIDNDNRSNLVFASGSEFQVTGSVRATQGFITSWGIDDTTIAKFGTLDNSGTNTRQILFNDINTLSEFSYPTQYIGLDFSIGKGLNIVQSGNDDTTSISSTVKSTLDESFIENTSDKSYGRITTYPDIVTLGMYNENYNHLLQLKGDNIQSSINDVNTGDYNTLSLYSTKTFTDRYIETNEGFVGKYIQLDTSATEPVNAGKIVWNSADGTFDMGLLNGVTLQAGQEIHMYAKASGAISNGDAVQFAGAQGDHLLIKKAVPSEITANPEYFVGVATQDFANNDFGYVTVFGLVRDLDTDIYPEGTVLYFDSMTVTDGLLTNIKPTGPNAKIIVAAVVRSHQNQGKIFVRPHVMQKIGDLQNVEISGVTDGDILAYDAIQQVWKNINLPSQPVPTLQSVTDEGNTTSNEIIITDGSSSTSIGPSSLYIENTTTYFDLSPDGIGIGDTTGANYQTSILTRTRTQNTDFYFEDEGGSKSIATREWTDDNKLSKSSGSTYTTNAILTVTQAEYDAIVTKDPTTLYFIV